MTTYSDPDVMVLVPHTPREDAFLRNYETWLSEVDNPFFNLLPGVAHYANWRIRTPNPAVPFTHVDCLRIEDDQTAADLATNAEVLEFGTEWTRLWGRYPDTDTNDPRLNGYLYLCHRVSGHRPKSRYLSFQTANEHLDNCEGGELWKVTAPIIGDVRFAYLRVVALERSEDFPATEEALPASCFGAALAELIAAPDAAETHERDATLRTSQ